ncbi:MAG: hypothetical protein V3U29_05080, partial [Phycisphaeraceae bacterium]
MPTQRAVIVSVVTLAALCLTAAGQQLELDAGVPTPLPALYSTQRAAEIDARIGALQKRRNEEANENRALVLTASIQLHNVARRLLLAADTYAGSSPAVLYGLKLANHLDEFDTLFNQYLRPIHARGGKADIDAAMRLINEQRRALERFIAASRAAMPILKGSDFSATRRYLSQALPDLLRFVEASGKPRPVNTWFSPTADQPLPTVKTIRALVERAAVLESGDEVRRQIAAVLDVLEGAWRFSEYLPQVAQAYRAMADTVDLLEAVHRAGWMSPEAVAIIEDSLSDALVLYADPNRRGEAEVLFVPLWRLTPLIDRITVLLSQDRANQPVADAFERAIDLATDRQTFLTAEAIFDWLGRVTRIMVDARAVAGAGLSGELRAAFVRIGPEYERGEAMVLSAAGRLVAAPESIHLPAITTPVAQLDRLQADLGRLTRLADAMRQFTRRYPG